MRPTGVIIAHEELHYKSMRTSLFSPEKSKLETGDETSRRLFLVSSRQWAFFSVLFSFFLVAAALELRIKKR